MKYIIKNLDHPDEHLELEKLVRKVIEVGDFTVGLYKIEPGWRWSTHARPHIGGELCQARHVGVIISGRLGMQFADGTTMEVGPYDVYECPPGHDTYVIGDEPCVNLEWSGSKAFAGNRAGADRELVTLMFTDLIGSTEMAARLGDIAWRATLSAHYETVRANLGLFRGREVKTAGDGVLATFNGPALALNCASRICDASRRQGLDVRIGIHVGEVERILDDVRGIAVHEAARIMSTASANEIMVSELTRTLASTSGFTFDDRGPHVLKGLAGEWHLFALQQKQT